MVKGLKKYQIEILKPLLEVAHIFDIKIVFFESKNNKDIGWTLMHDNKVHIPVSVKLFNGDYENIYSVFFHELVHILNYREGYFPAYHRPKPTKMGRLMERRTALRAELFTDKRAKELMSYFFPKLKYSQHYKNNEKSKKFIHKILDNHYMMAK